MGARKRIKAELRKEARKNVAFASLKNCPTSPRKMRLVADMVRGMGVEKALFLLAHSPKEASNRLETLVRSAVNNWEQKNEEGRMEDAGLFIAEVSVDSGRMLKRIQPAPHGRAHRVRKRSNHVTVVLGERNATEEAVAVNTEETN